MKCKSYSHFFSKNISVYAIFNDQSFNDTLTNDIVSFEQLGPDQEPFVFFSFCGLFSNICPKIKFIGLTKTISIVIYFFCEKNNFSEYFFLLFLRNTVFQYMMFHNDNEEFRHFGQEFVQNILPNFLPQSIFFNNYGAKLSILFFFYQWMK